jgi:flavin-dependent dehydrogenase
MTEVKTMSGIDDRWRDLVVDGAPIVTGLVAVGDSVVATNPAFGRGSSLAWISGRALADAVAAHGGDLVDIATAHHAEMTSLVRAWYDQQVSMDSTRLAGMRRILAGEPPAEPDANDPMATIPIGLALASSRDPEVFRAMGKIAHVLDDPMAILSDPHVFGKAIEAYEQYDGVGLGEPGPTRDELLAAMATAGSPAAAG